MASLPPLLIDVPRNAAVAVGLPLVLSAATGYLTRNGAHNADSLHYKSLEKPPAEPPRWAFGVVWPVLYAAMGYASHLTVKTLDRTPPGLGRDKVRLALGLYYAQLGLNMVWSPLSFGAGRFDLALIDMVALGGTTAYWFKTLREVDVPASNLVIPYLGWLAYATYLNGGIWWLNQGKYLFGKAKKEVEKKKP